MDAIRTKLNSILNKVKPLPGPCNRQVARDIGLDAGKGVKLEEDSKNGFVLRVTRKDEKGSSICLN